jgi:hypothetical protein
MVQDLSEVHTPIGGFLERVANSKQLAAFRLSDEQLSDFERDGFLKGIDALSSAQVQELRLELSALIKESHPAHHFFYEYHSNESTDLNTTLFHALGAWRIEPGFHDVLWNPAMLVPMAQLLQGPVRLWHDQLFCKPAHHGGVVAWHQDYSFWTCTEPMTHLTCWIGLDDSTKENGCLYYVPGSHRWNLLPKTGLTGKMDEIMTVLTPKQQAEFKPVPIEMKAGQCSFHHPLLVHGSYANCSDRPRRATLVNVFRDGVKSASDDELLAGVPRIARGARMDGQFFPMLFDPNVAHLGS